MIFPLGYIPFSDVLALWAARIELLDSLKEREERPKTLPVRELLEDLEDKIPAYIIGIDGVCLRITNKVFETFTRADLEADFVSFSQLSDAVWQLVQDDEQEDAPELDELSDFFRVPIIGEYQFLHFNPVLSTIDTSGAQFVRGLLEGEYSHAEHGCLEIALCDDDAPVLEQVTVRQFNRLISYRDIFAGYKSVIYAKDGFGFEQYEGRSICFTLEDVERYLDDNYPLEEEKVSRLVNAERAAEQAFRSFMEKKPVRIRREDARRMFCPKLGARASKRVWDSVAKDYPFLSAPGRRKEDI